MSGAHVMAVDEKIHADPIFYPMNIGRRRTRLLIGCVLLRKKLGEGGMCSVYLGHHMRLNIPVAVKILKKHGIEEVREFLREARLMAELEHPNLVRVLDINREHVNFNSNIYYMVMEYVEGCTAFDMLHRFIRGKGHPIPALKAIKMVCDAAEGLAAAHARGIVHRDIKPENLLVRVSDGTVKVADLGLAVDLRGDIRAGESDRPKAIVGTPGFVAPELLVGEPPAPASDVYSLGVTLYELISGVLPFGEADDGYAARQIYEEPRDLRAAAPATPDLVADFAMRCISRDMSWRFADCGGVAAAAREIIARIEAGSAAGRAAAADAVGVEPEAAALYSCA
ncbi:MAG: serine/threonine protein kinase [Planctomycetota bacterium]|nr:serine/threonine protein kinase [Planctomycetota bacterium]